MSFALKVARIDKVLFLEGNQFEIKTVGRVMVKHPGTTVFDCGGDDRYFVRTNAINDSKITADGKILTVTSDMLSRD